MYTNLKQKIAMFFFPFLRDRNGQRERKRERQTDRQTEAKTDKSSDRQRERLRTVVQNRTQCLVGNLRFKMTKTD